MKIKDLRPFIPSKDFAVSKSFYVALGFSMVDAGPDLSIFSMADTTFFLQSYYNEQLAKNLMLQLIVEDIEEVEVFLAGINSIEVKHSEVKQEAWGKVIYLWGPSGELWHFTELKSTELKSVKIQ